MTYSITVNVSGLVDGENADAADVTTPIANLKTAVQDLGNGVSGPEKFRLVHIATPASPPASGSVFLYAKSDNVPYVMDSSSGESALGVTLQNVCDGRLSLTSGTPVTTADVTGATTLYFVPYNGGYIALYSGTSWGLYALTERSLSLSGLTANLPHDIFIYNNAGTLTLEALAWTNTTTRATALTTQNGVYVKTGATTRRYLGTICTTSSTGTTEDSKLNRLVWNHYNRVSRELSLIDTTDTWTYATATWRQWNNSASNRVTFVRGVDEDIVHLAFLPLSVVTGSVNAACGINLDATSGTPTAVNSTSGSTVVFSTLSVIYNKCPGVGYHYLQMMEFASGATVTFAGDSGLTYAQSSARGFVMA